MQARLDDKELAYLGFVLGWSFDEFITAMVLEEVVDDAPAITAGTYREMYDEFREAIEDLRKGTLLNMALTAYERETVILMSDGGDTALITTWQRRWIAKLRRNPAAEIVEIQNHNGSTGVTFRLPAKLISVRNPRQVSEETRAKLAENISQARDVLSQMQQPLVTRMEPVNVF